MWGELNGKSHISSIYTHDNDEDDDDGIRIYALKREKISLKSNL